MDLPWDIENFYSLPNSQSIERRALFSYRARLMSFGFSNCLTEERSEAESSVVQFENEVASYCAL